MCSGFIFYLASRWALTSLVVELVECWRNDCQVEQSLTCQSLFCRCDLHGLSVRATLQSLTCQTISKQHGISTSIIGYFIQNHCQLPDKCKGKRILKNVWLKYRQKFRVLYFRIHSLIITKVNNQILVYHLIIMILKLLPYWLLSITH